MQEKRSAMCVAVITNKIYVFGGYDESNALCTVEMFNIYSNKWITLSSMENRRCAGAAATLNDLIYSKLLLYFIKIINFFKFYLDLNNSF